MFHDDLQKDFFFWLLDWLGTLEVKVWDIVRQFVPGFQLPPWYHTCCICLQYVKDFPLWNAAFQTTWRGLSFSCTPGVYRDNCCSFKMRAVMFFPHNPLWLCLSSWSIFLLFSFSVWMKVLFCLAIIAFCGACSILPLSWLATCFFNVYINLRSHCSDLLCHQGGQHGLCCCLSLWLAA